MQYTAFGEESQDESPRGNVSFIQEIRGKMPDFQKLATTSNEEPSASCHCERSEAISLQIGGLLRRLRRLAMTRIGMGGELLLFSNFLN
jgi:hypothetical protein